MYITLFDTLEAQFDPLSKLPKWTRIAPNNRALIVGIFIVVVLILLSGTAVTTTYHYVPLIILGLFSGGVVAKVSGRFLAPKIQSHVTAFLGGITTGNIGSSGSSLRKLISATADQINKLVTMLPKSAGDLSGAMTLSLWIALVTALVVLATNAYYANLDSSAVGNLLPPVPVPAPPAPAPATPGP